MAAPKQDPARVDGTEPFTVPPRLWAREHGEGYAVPATVEALVRDGLLQDESYRNDMCPCFKSTADQRMVLWVDHPRPSRRGEKGDGPTTRYMVVRLVAVEECEGETVYEGNDLQAALVAMGVR